MPPFLYLIDKNLPNDEIEEILNGVRNRTEIDIVDVFFDDDLLLKINEIFGSYEDFI